MSEMERDVVAVLAAHAYRDQDMYGYPSECECGEWIAPKITTADEDHRTHVANALAPLIVEREAEAWDEGRVRALEDVAYKRSTPNPYRKCATPCHAAGLGCDCTSPTQSPCSHGQRFCADCHGGDVL